MKKKRKDNIYIPKPYKQGFGNPGKPNITISLYFSNYGLYFSNYEYDQFLRRQQQLKTKKK